MRTTIDLDDSLLSRLRDDAHRENISFRAMLHRVLLRGLEPRESGSEAPYAPPSYAMGKVREGIDLVKALQLAGELEDAEVLSKQARGR